MRLSVSAFLLPSPDQFEILVVGDVTPSHALEVRGFYLAVDESAPMAFKYYCEVDEGHLAATWHEREHALPYESPTDGDTI